jgi:hypothetical protein
MAQQTEDSMAGVISDLKAHARILHRQVGQRDPHAVARTRQLAEFKGHDPSSLPASIKRRHCLAIVARELGFQGWPHAVGVLRGVDSSDFGTLLYPDGADVHWNIWSASYGEARAIREQHGGYLLAYRRHFFIVDRYFIETLGLQPEDPDWDLIGRDWVKPRQPDARERLYGKLIRRWAMSANVK